MRRTGLVLLVLTALALGCSDEGARQAAQQAALKAQGAVAARNLEFIREAVLKYHQAHKKAPQSMDDLGPHGANKLEADPNYSEIAYGFSGLKFDAEGKLAAGVFYATPIEGKPAPDVAMDAATGRMSFRARPQPPPVEKSNASTEIRIGQ